MKKILPILGVAAFAASPAFAAHVGTITDTSPGSATNDGVINAGEYAGSTNGINAGFGDVIGETSSVFLDSSTSGAINLGIRSANNFNDTAVFYIDSVTGGVASTAPINDTSDGGRAAISGNAASGESSEITFAPGAAEGASFLADYAVTVENSFAGIFEIGDDGSLTFVNSANLTVGGDGSTAARERELSFSLADIGLAAGGSFNYFGTYLNSGNAFRSNEFQGVRDRADFDSNVGQNPVLLADGDYLTFESVPVPEPASLALVALGGVALLGRRRA